MLILFVWVRHIIKNYTSELYPFVGSPLCHYCIIFNNKNFCQIYLNLEEFVDFENFVLDSFTRKIKWGTPGLKPFRTAVSN